jgi:hypothetical protein
MREREGLVPRGKAALLHVQRGHSVTGRLALGLLLGFTCMVALACGASPKQSMSLPAPGEHPRSVVASSPHDEIAELAADIDRQRVELNLPEPTACESCVQPMSEGHTPTAPPTRNPSCPSVPSDRCTSVCTVSDSICGNATKICNLAAQLPGDAWATGKCSTASETCRASQERCCTCAE